MISLISFCVFDLYLQGCALVGTAGNFFCVLYCVCAGIPSVLEADYLSRAESSSKRLVAFPNLCGWLLCGRLFVTFIYSTLWLGSSRPGSIAKYSPFRPRDCHHSREPRFLHSSCQLDNWCSIFVNFNKSFPFIFLPQVWSGPLLACPPPPTGLKLSRRKEEATARSETIL